MAFAGKQDSYDHKHDPPTEGTSFFPEKHEGHILLRLIQSLLLDRATETSPLTELRKRACAHSYLMAHFKVEVLGRTTVIARSNT